MRDIVEALELVDAHPGVDVLPEEYVRLLGYPRGWVLEGRALELADWARDWYSKNGRPWFYARQAEHFEIRDDVINIDGAQFACKRMQATLQQAGAHTVVLVAVSAGPEAEAESHRRWQEGKPDEYFFLEMFGSAVVEHLAASTGARLCEWAEQREMAVLPHYSPGYPEWDVAEQPRLLELMKRGQRQPFPSAVEVFETGMLRPKKTLLAVFGLTRHTERLSRLAGLVPCENCSFGPCQFRRAPYRRAPRSWGEQIVRASALNQDANYSVNRKALKRWAEERLLLRENEDGSVDAVFRYDGTTCTNMGRPLTFQYNVKVGPRANGYPILDQRCTPAPGDDGYTLMCEYIANPSQLTGAIDRERPLHGERLDAVFSWQREASVAGCYCESASRDHKWGLVLETIHYALAQKEITQDKDLL
ncbi:MAG TPA: hypothetical protein VN678_07445 [Acidobacteriaceae bacterium]|nr:hypothetical protein [Acidobacteriaceae bacterium]